ncbi:hypothetical protein LQ772_09580 [Frateuria edaphi]|uniref:hypothetical protein n=1 Tax=Frateuria edaphi TaxID=2898793 RepID=UPI001E435DDA|nr:hypothetical protein [Frateuria edaphi]UGB44256.1 hypothetical protein LQ772_09580 [Frateuria edaphi]
MFITIARTSGSEECGSRLAVRRLERRGSTGGLAARRIARVALVAFALLGAVAQATGSYPRMGPVKAYLMERGEEIALARSAAPASISRDATVLVLTPTGYETAVTGTNGFVWGSPGFQRCSGLA